MIKKYADRFFRWFCKPEYYIDIRGDLEELYQEKIQSSTKFRAELSFVKEVLLLFRISLIRPFYPSFNHSTMFIHHLTIAWRHLTKNPTISLIHIMGLVIGMTAALMIWKYISFERSYDTFHDKADRIYRVRTDRLKDGEPFMQFAAGTACAGPLLKAQFPQVKHYVKLRISNDAVYATNNEHSFKVEDAYFAMPSLFDIFSFDLVSGDPKTCLDKPFTVCISTSLAKKFFGDEDPIGQTLTRNGTEIYTITGVFPDIPANSHFKFNLLISYVTFSDVLNKDSPTETSATWDGFYTYLLLHPDTDWKSLEAEFPAAIERTFDREMRENVAFHLQPLTDIHLTSHYLIEAEANGDKTSVFLLSIIGIMILIIAWVNYINLSTARASIRAKEVGIRKVVGVRKGKLVTQFLLETALINAVAFVISLVLVHILNTPFEALVGKAIPVSIFNDYTLLLSTLGIFLLGVVLSGLYPSFQLSAYRPIQALKSGFTKLEAQQRINLRKGLVLVQFIASAGLIASTILIYHQLQYLQKTNLGLNMDQMLILKGPIKHDSTTFPNYHTFMQEVAQFASVKQMSGSTSIPGQGFGWTIGTVIRLGGPKPITRAFHAMAADEAYTQMYEMELAAGRHLKEEMGTDQIACLLNETGAAKLEFNSPEEAIGTKLELKNGNQLTIVGILKDFYQKSPKSVIEPLLLVEPWGTMIPSYFSVKLSTEQLTQTIGQIESKWGEFFPGNPFEYFFLDDHFNKQYAADKRFGYVFSLFSGLAIFISCLGLFALIAFTIERKRKEIGIRKVLGASVSGILYLLSQEVLKLALISMLIATPIVWYFIQQWLENFAHHISIQWWVFIFAGILIVFITLTTVSYHSLKAAMANPVDSLRDE